MLDYQFILQKRVFDIEDMIDKHFSLIKQVLIDKLQKHFKDENEKMQMKDRITTLVKYVAIVQTKQIGGGFLCGSDDGR